MTIKTEIKVDKENKVLTLLVTVPRKKFAREDDVSFTGADAWETVKNYGVSGYKVEERSSGLVVDNWRVCNHTGEYSFPMEETKSAAKPKAKPKVDVKTKEDDEPIKQPAPSTRKPKSKKI